jgi:hypothetical protein
VLKQKLKTNQYDTFRFLNEDYLDKYFREEWKFDASNAAADSVVIHHVGDDNALHECVHVIHTNARNKQVCLTFRGSITIQDWMKDAKMVSGELSNPLVNFFDNNNQDDNDDIQPEHLGVHLGFRDYLYGDAPSLLPTPLSKLQDFVVMTTDHSSNHNREEKPRKIDVIMEQVKELMDQHADYTLCITGHSLGAALAQLACLEATVRFGQEGRPVTCVTIASPRVGDNNFRAAIQTLERKRLLRFLAVSNKYDLVPLAPNRFCRCDFCRPNQFCQPGIQLKLSQKSFTTTYHSEKNDTLWEEFYSEMKRLLIMFACGIRMAEQHNYRTYVNRIIAQKEELSKISLNDLYEKQNIYF